MSLSNFNWLVAFFTRPDLVTKITVLQDEVKYLSEEVHKLRAELGEEVAKAREWHRNDAASLLDCEQRREEDQVRHVVIHRANKFKDIYITRLEAALTEAELPLPEKPEELR